MMDYEFFLKDYDRLEGERICLRRFSLGDVGDVYEYMSDPEVTRHLAWEQHTAIAQTIELLKKEYIGSSFFYAIALKDTDRCIGTIQFKIDPQNSKGSFTYCIGAGYWGQGYMPEVLSLVIDFYFSTLGLNRVEGTHFAENPNSGRVQEKCGLSLEGVMRQSALVKGVYHDVVMRALLREDWLKTHPQNES